MTDPAARSAVQAQTARPLLVAALTDYGLGSSRALLEAVTRQASGGGPWLDIDHGIALGDVRAGALALRRTLIDLEPCVCVAVVDPGVGTNRRPVALRTGTGHFLVGPDNGLLEPAARRLGGVAELADLSRSPLRRESRARTFDGRDLFAPVAGALAAGATIAEVGTPADPHSLVVQALPSPRRTPGGIEATVLEVDRFGTLVLALDEQLSLIRPLPELGTHGTVTAGPIRRAFHSGFTFADVEPGALVLYPDSDGALALARRDGSAAQLLLASPGTLVELAPDEGPAAT